MDVSQAPAVSGSEIGGWVFIGFSLIFIFHWFFMGREGGEGGVVQAVPQGYPQVTYKALFGAKKLHLLCKSLVFLRKSVFFAKKMSKNTIVGRFFEAKRSPFSMNKL